VAYFQHATIRQEELHDYDRINRAFSCEKNCPSVKIVASLSKSVTVTFPAPVRRMNSSPYFLPGQILYISLTPYLKKYEHRFDSRVLRAMVMILFSTSCSDIQFQWNKLRVGLTLSLNL
jgi:hypothetical protein